MPTIDKINGIDEDDISHHNGGAASLYTSKNGDTWGHYSFQGSNYGYVCGGNPRDEIEKFQFSTDGDATDVGNLSASGRVASSGQSSGTYVYQAGGTGSLGTIIQQIAVASDGDAVDGGDITSTYNEDKSGNSSSTHGYTSCGYGSWSSPANDKFLFASGTNNAVDIGDPVTSRYSVGSQSSTTTGYFAGGWPSAGSAVALIDRFEFASEGNCTDSGDLDEGMGSLSGQSSTTHGYATCGHGTGVNDNRNHIKKFAFASGTQNATDIGDMTVARRRVAGVSGVTHGYACGGYTTSAIDTTDKFSFSSDGNGTDVLNLATARDYVGGTQY